MSERVSREESVKEKEQQIKEPTRERSSRCLVCVVLKASTVPSG